VFGLAVRLAAKAFEAGRVLLALAKDLGPAFVHGFDILPPLVRAEVAGAAFVLGLSVLGLAAFGVRKIGALGGRP
jgi:hypothetical protein